MISNTTDRERLASDLELLGLLADPNRGPLAHLLSPTQPPAKRTTLLTFLTGGMDRSRAAVLMLMRRVRPVWPARVRRMPARAAQTR